MLDVNDSSGLLPSNEPIRIDCEVLESPDTPAITKDIPVLDAHPPHAGIHTWKDFWIHLATISLGLLIAIGLEQSVEWVHHLHQRHQLEANLREEGLRNRSYAEIDVALYNKITAWLIQLQRGVDAARTAGEKTPFVYPERPDGVPDSPRYVAYHVLSTEAWTTAKESAMIALLPREEAEIYARIYLQSDQVQDMRQGAFETRFSQGTYPPVFDLSRLTPGQLDEYEAVLADELEDVRIANSRLKIFIAADDYVLSGGKSEDDLRDAALKETAPK